MPAQNRSQPMTLGNMRQNGVRSLIVWCSNVNCRHEAIVNVGSQPDDVFVPSLGPTNALPAVRPARC
jgi:hypothetical protein